MQNLLVLGGIWIWVNFRSRMWMLYVPTLTQLRERLSAVSWLDMHMPSGDFFSIVDSDVLQRVTACSVLMS